MKNDSKVLLIEDNAGDVRLIREMFRENSRHEAELTIVSTMREAEGHLATRQTDLILLDLGLPDAQGLEAVRLAHEAAPHVPLVVLTGLDDELLAVKALKEGAQDYLVKGDIDSRGLLRSVRYSIERKTAEKALRAESHELHKKEARIRSIAENLPGFLFQCFVDEADCIRFEVIWTPGFEFLDPMRSTSSGTAYSVLESVHPSDRQKLTDAIINARRIGSNWEQTLRLVAPADKELWVHATALMRPGEAGDTVWDGVALDVTDQIAMEMRNAELHVKLRQAEKLEAIGTLAGGVAHELNNLLQPIIMMTELVLANSLQSHRQVELLQRVVDAGNKAAEIVQRILAFGRIDEATLQLLDAATIVGEAVGFISPLLPSSITLNVDIGENVGMILGDKTQLTQVMINLVTNARDAIGAKVGTLSISLSNLGAGCDRPVLRAGVILRGAYAVLKVSDTGTGMDEAVVRRAFEPFFTTKEVGKGTGLGLSVTYGIVTGHGGQIQVDSIPDRGTTFSIYLPIKEVLSTAANPGAASNTASAVDTESSLSAALSARPEFVAPGSRTMHSSSR